MQNHAGAGRFLSWHCRKVLAAFGIPIEKWDTKGGRPSLQEYHPAEASSHFLSRVSPCLTSRVSLQSLTRLQQSQLPQSATNDRSRNMSFGIGIGDCVLILRGLVRCWSLLRGEAVNGFAEHAEAYRSFYNGARCLRRYLKAEGRVLGPYLSEEVASLNRLFKDFLARIQ